MTVSKPTGSQSYLSNVPVPLEPEKCSRVHPEMSLREFYEVGFGTRNSSRNFLWSYHLPLTDRSQRRRT